MPLSLLSLRIDGVPVELRSGSTVAAAMVIAGVDFARRSVNGEPRAPLCGMGVCFECRVSIDGVAHRRACQVICRSGMEVSTDD